jgi:hypothetical protein
MKRILLAVAMFALISPALQEQAQARVDVSIDFFYDNLGDGGSWVEVGDYGYCWQPSVAVSNTSWRPYTDGYWAYTDLGWTWISYEDFGWATYHYGRWMRLRGRGWVWVPGREWGPAWVSWRTGGDYVGWAPLPPRRAGEYWDESPITARVDIDFDIGPASYNFLDVRYIGEPVLRERIFAPEQNVTYITKTVNVTNITYTNSTVYSYGPDYNTLSRYSSRPIQRLSLQRETNVDPTAAAQSKSLMKVQGDKLVVAAPQQFQKPTTKVAPKVVKEKIAQAPVEKGWDPVGDPKAQAELKEKIKKEDPKSVPPPTVQASEKAAPNASASVSPAVNPTAAPGKNKNKRNEKAAPLASPSVSAPPAMTPAPSRDRATHREREKAAPNASVPPVDAAAPPVAPKSPKEKPDKRKVEPLPPPSAVAPAPRVAPPAMPEKKREIPAPDAAKPEAAVEKPKRAPEEIAPKKEAPPSLNPPAARDEGKKQKKNEPATSPTP